jgi:hypothetical protein
MAENINIGHYFVAFIDIVGQRDKLNQLISLPRTEKEKQHIAEVIVEISEYVKQLRAQFNDFFNSAKQSTGLLDRLTPEQRKWAEQRKRSIIWRRGFSDSYIITIPCWYESRFGVHIGDISSCLYGICALSLWALTMRKPLRGGVEVHLGIEIEEHEVYGPVAVWAYDLESTKAEYPCVAIGQGLLNHLADIEPRCLDNPDGRHTLIDIKNCRSFITTDIEGKPILDIMGEGVKSVETEVTPHLVKDAYKFVISQEKHFAKLADEKHTKRYSQLRQYCESRLSLWGIKPQI